LTAPAREREAAPPDALRLPRRLDLTPYWLILPTALYLGVFFIYPMSQAVWLAVQDPRSGQLTWEHFHRMTTDVHFAAAVRYTLLVTALAVPLQVALGLAIALMVNTRFRGHSLFLYLCAIPIGISDLAAGLIWLSVFTERGYLNAALGAVGAIQQPVTWLSFERRDWLVSAIVITEVWRATAIVMIILVAGMQLIARDYVETAHVFGASRWRTLRDVVLPLLRPSLQTALIIRTILAFQLFATVITLSGRLVPVMAGESYFWYTLYRNANVASAYALLILLFSGSITYVYLRALRQRELEVPR
jgi:multiple sugar transport system permease protein